MRPLPAPAADALRALDRAEAARPVELAFGRWLAGLDPARGETLALTGALLAGAAAEGHSRLDLDAWAGRPYPGDAPALPLLPERAAWTAALAASPLVGTTGEARPLVLDGGSLYLYRHWHAEGRVAARLAALLTAPPPDAPPDDLRELFAALFPPSSQTPDWQAVAAVAALLRPLCLITGGPGTGKTTTAARALALLLQAEPDLRVALAAPTGKAAQRLGESMAAGCARLPLSDRLRTRIPTAASTLHRLLGYSPSRGRFSFGPGHPVPYDVVLVDEGSMVDLLLFDALLAALPPHARLLILGDADQLASVGTGAVFGDLCRAGASSAAGRPFVAEAERLGLHGVPVTDGEPGPLADAVVTLRHTYRFGADSGVGQLARHTNAGDADGALAVLADEAIPDARLVPTAGLTAEVLARVGPAARALCGNPPPEEALGLVGRVRMLAATREGRLGVSGLNGLVEDWLVAGGLSPRAPYYPGRPLLITANDYAHGLYNGDVGVCLLEGDRLAAYFPAEGGGVRAVPISQLPTHESAWATTVHKSQGSEFDEVVLVLPEADSELLTRELLYTAVTRARQCVTIVGAPATVRAAVGRPSVRQSSLAPRLAALLSQHADPER